MKIRSVRMLVVGGFCSLLLAVAGAQFNPDRHKGEPPVQTRHDEGGQRRINRIDHPIPPVRANAPRHDSPNHMPGHHDNGRHLGRRMVKKSVHRRHISQATRRHLLQEALRRAAAKRHKGDRHVPPKRR